MKPFPDKLTLGAWRLLLAMPREPLTSTGETMSAFFARTRDPLAPGHWPRGADDFERRRLRSWRRAAARADGVTCDDCAPEFKQTKAEKFDV